MAHPNDAIARLGPYLRQDAEITVAEDGIVECPPTRQTPGLDANTYYFGQAQWMDDWLRSVHRYPEFVQRWRAVTGDWNGKVVVDIGCGPGNVGVALGISTAALLVGVDVARGSLLIAREHGYVPLLADAQDLPFVSGFADLVVINATIHHCDDMPKTLAAAGRLLRPGGLLVTDNDPQRSAYHFRGLGKALWEMRKPIYRVMGRGGHRAADNEQAWAIATEIHHRVGDGVDETLFHRVLEPLGFEVRVYPHNQRVGRAILNGEHGRAPWRIRLAQRLSRIDCDSAAAAMSLMCVARRRSDAEN